MNNDLVKPNKENGRKPPLPNPFVSRMEGYKITSQELWLRPDKSKMLKLDWNESTVINPKLHKFINKLCSEAEHVYWYPDANCTELTAAIAKYLSLTPPEILVFAGSDEALESICVTYLQAGDCVATVNPTYDNFRIYVERLGAISRPIYLGDPFGFNLDDFLKKIEPIKPSPKLIYIINPNSPVGYKICTKDIETLLIRFPDTIVVVDEAYVEFSGDSCCQLVRKYPNLIVARSFSKAFGLAGLRIGYTVSDMRNHAYLSKVRNGKNITMFGQQAAKYLLESIDCVNEHIKMICMSRQWFIEAMRCEGAIVFDSAANFVMMKVPHPQDVVIQLYKRDICIRDRSWMKQLDGMIRITVGYQKQMKRVLDSFKSFDRDHWVFKKESF